MYVHDPDQARKERLILENVSKKSFRLQAFYHIIDKDARKVLYTPNRHQRHLLKHAHNRNIILKARQLGFTTHKTMELLDACLFGENQAAGLIAHTKDIAERIFRDKVQFAFDNLPPVAQAMVGKPKKNRDGEIIFRNDSRFYVDNSMRSGTLTHLHVSEFGRICATDQAKADEIIEGAMQAVSKDQFIDFESTAEGPTGHFYDYCMMAMETMRQGRQLTNMDWKFFFFPWWEDPEYSQPDWKLITIPEEIEQYFTRLETDREIRLKPAQKAFYVQKLQEFCRSRVINFVGWDNMRKEYPSYPDEAFSRSLEGAYYANEMSLVDREGRITQVPHNPYVKVDTWWDLGHSDSTSIWFTQTIGRKIHVIDFYENHLHGLPHYYNILAEKQRSQRYSYGRMVAPHDIEVHELSHGMTRREMAKQHGVNFEVAARGSLADGIESVRQILHCCWFDEAKCGPGIASLRAYERDKDKRTGDWLKNPKKGKANHGADAFRTMAVMHEFDFHDGRSRIAPIQPTPASAWT